MALWYLVLLPLAGAASLPAEAEQACGPNVIKGVILANGYSADAATTIRKLACGGGNAIQVSITCSQSSIMATTQSCPEPPAAADTPGKMDATSKLIWFAKCAGLKVMLQVVLTTQDQNGEIWAADIGRNAATEGIANSHDFTEQEWNHWAGHWAENLEKWAIYAQSKEVDIMSIGAELITPQAQESQWRTIVSRVKQHYNGLLSYASDKRHEGDVKWWDAINFVGTDPYFRLANHTENPQPAELAEAWAPITQNLAPTVVIRKDETG